MSQKSYQGPDVRIEEVDDEDDDVDDEDDEVEPAGVAQTAFAEAAPAAIPASEFVTIIGWTSTKNFKILKKKVC